MNFIIMDLEWNGVFSGRHQRFINEIIELGAVRLNASLAEVNIFSSLVRSKVGRRLCGKVKELTRLSHQELMDSGQSFAQVLERFTQFVQPDDVVLTWSNTDLHVLLDNCKCFAGAQTIPFLTHYADLQSYVQDRLEQGTARQLGLINAALLLDIDTSDYASHRALDDCRLSADILRHTYSPEAFLPFVRKAANEEFYHRLCFKTHFISDFHDPRIPRSKLQFRCPDCGLSTHRKSPWAYKNRYFKANFFAVTVKKNSVDVFSLNRPTIN